MSALIVFMISIFMIFGVFPMVLMIYATIRDKRAAREAALGEAQPGANPSGESGHVG